jgi:hypothetical protein
VGVGGGAYLVESKVAALKSVAQHSRGVVLFAAFGRHFLARLVLVPPLACHLPLDESVDLQDGGAIVDDAPVQGVQKQAVHVQSPRLRSELEKA